MASSFQLLPLSASPCGPSSDLELIPGQGRRKKSGFGLNACQNWVVPRPRASQEIAGDKHVSPLVETAEPTAGPLICVTQPVLRVCPVNPTGGAETQPCACMLRLP